MSKGDTHFLIQIFQACDFYALHVEQGHQERKC